MAYASVSVEGGFFPSDMLDRIAAGDTSMPGQRQSDFGVNGGRRLTDEIQSAFSAARSYWTAFQYRLQRSRESRTTITREYWVTEFLELLGFQRLVVQRSSAEVGSDRYFISHRAGDFSDAPPVHIVAMDQRLDRRDGPGRRSPHALVQEYLNRSDALWGIVTNGREIRLLRDTARLAKPTFLGFDLEGMMVGNLYSEFVLLYRLLHVSRFPREAASAHECLLERYYQQGIDEGSRVRDKLRLGVHGALETLGNGFLAHHRSEALRGRFETGELDASGYYRQLLRLVYRLLFLMVAEERRLIFPANGAGTERQAIYTKYYGVSMLRERADRYFAEDQHTDLWLGLSETFHLLRDNDAAGLLGLSALNGELFSRLACSDLENAICTNESLLLAIRELSTFREDGGQRRRVNYAGLDVEEFGSVYESLLDFHPQVTFDPPSFRLVAGSERKQTGSYYTPPELVRELIESALVPVMQDRLRGLKTKEEREAALLDLRVCDPASGSGHFLLAAARRIARELATARSGEETPSPDDYRTALRDVIRQCIYAVDKNPLAIDLCKVALWIEGHSAGLPLSFLDHHIKCGDSLVGVTNLELLQEGIPDEAYKRTDARQRQLGRHLARRNAAEHRGQIGMELRGKRLEQHLFDMALVMEELKSAPDDLPEHVAQKAARYEAARALGQDWWVDNTACHLWTSAFFLDITDGDTVPTTDTVRRYLSNPGAAYGPLVGKAWQAAQDGRYKFFHWALEFPDVFEGGGFDVILSNPPFMGGLKIGGEFGTKYRNYLTTVFSPARGIIDLCAYFYRQAYQLLRPNGHMGMVATNTISQGDTREAGLAVIIGKGGVINFAHKFIKWPGAASVEVNLLAIRKGPWPGQCLLDANHVSFISSRLDQEQEEEPQRLPSNEGKAFIGDYVRGMGFTLDPEEAKVIIGKNRFNQDCLLPYLNGKDFNSDPEHRPSRWVICFFDWPLEKAKRYIDLLRIVEERVKPERDKVKDKHERDNWWLFARYRVEMREAIASLNRVLVRSRVSELHALAYVPTGIVASDSTVVFAFDDDYHFALLQSSIHEVWLRRNATTLRTDVMYTPEDCFDTFPFPQEPLKPDRELAERVGTEYYEHRIRVMQSRSLGLTKTYNLFNSPECQDSDIQKLRDLHAEMDRAILACYGWQNLDPGHGFHQNERGQTRHTVSPDARREILRRLLDLNLKIASEEAGGELDGRIQTA